jgi:phage terminase large subunit
MINLPGQQDSRENRQGLRVEIPAAFAPLFQPSRYKVFYGGRDGAKSWSFAKALLIMAAQRPLRVLCTREYQSSIAESVYKVLVDQISKMNLEDLYEEPQRTVIRSKCGSEFIFKGLKMNIMEIKSTEGVDICFSAGTLIGDTPIEEVQIGDMVESYNHNTGKIELRRVYGTTKVKRTQPLYKTLTHNAPNGIVSTGNHPIYVKGIGYIPITSLKRGDIVYEKVRTAGVSELLGWMWRSYRNKHKGETCEISKERRSLLHRLREEIKFRKNESFQSNEQSSINRQNEKILQNKRDQAIGSWWEWERLYKVATGAFPATWPWMVAGIGDYDGQEKVGFQGPEKLQGRFSKYLLQIGDRDKRYWAPRSTKQRRGPQKRNVLKEHRVDNVELLKQQDIERLGFSDGGHYVYNLGIEVNNNYFANGILVHNCWIEEAQMASDESWSVLIPTIRKPNSEIWISFNTGQADDPTFRRFVTSPPPDSIVRKINYDLNPFHSELMEKERQYLLRVDPEAHDHIWLGNPLQISDACIFKGKFETDTFEAREGEQLFYGCDWGFSNDPTALVRSFIRDNKLFVEHEAYGVGVELDEIPDLFDSVPGSRDWPILADNSRPETISYVKKKTSESSRQTNGPVASKTGFRFCESLKRSSFIPDADTRLKNFSGIHGKRTSNPARYFLSSYLPMTTLSTHCAIHAPITSGPGSMPDSRTV